ncbi:tetratricopeptide repeat protein [Pedobacter agri]|uniref:tetratricopeptide repeat protein n=1 Tax=Pedobacter agri TaxID=454586 RepID=UPI00277D98FD|nr:tetratricopeptide repeat protein [Pedobacter agri]MDQ1141962.1 tetratricopeptide (TPR) repeat protein [Pedobacter agri]
MKKLLIICMLFSLQALGQAQTGAIDKEKIFDLYQNQRYAEAGEYLKTSYGSETTDLKALTQIGYCFLMAGNNVEAEKYYAKADAIQPGNLPILFSLASINTRRGNTEKAKLYYGNIVKLDSNNFIVYKLLANLYLSDKDSLKMVYLLKANKLVPTDGDVAADLAAVHSVYQNYDRAYEVLNVAIKADPENLVLQRTKLPIANLLKKYDEVIASGESLLKDNKDASVIKDLAKAYYYTKKYDKAVTLFRQLEGNADAE